MTGFEIADGETVWFVNEYETDRQYGGPEEGGWWYDTGRFVRCRGVFKDRDAAAALRDRIQTDELPKRRKGLHSPSSMLSEGLWPVVLMEDHPGRDYPRERPRYE
ncbi:MAG: hypothetical protein F4107_10845 [Gemmatimonadetes bacterium]|nr:hypothetical protein [Gemmatimonadota bacterium]MYD15173.1 hypothetical protein [Gemmatimonadota bacterium]MYI66408.1 hypothetical protein [Gemmatimonadota bacterium]